MSARRSVSRWHGERNVADPPESPGPIQYNASAHNVIVVLPASGHRPYGTK